MEWWPYEMFVWFLGDKSITEVRVFLCPLKLSEANVYFLDFLSSETATDTEIN